MFEPRLAIPKSGNKYYNRKPTGYNPCILGNYPRDSEKRTGRPGLNVLPNCVGYATGRFNEIANINECHWLGNTNAKLMLKHAQLQGLKTGSTPKLGAAIVWDGGSGYGHIAIVEKIISPVEILVSESGWSYNGIMWTATHKKGIAGNWTDGGDASWMKNKYTFLGFIYQPKEIEEMTQDEFNKMADKYIESRNSLPASKYAEEALKWSKKNGIMSGDEKGNQMPQGFLTRQDFAVSLKKLFDKLF